MAIKKKVGYANYRLSPLKQITDQAKKLTAKNPKLKWVDAIKKAGAIYRGGSKKVAGKKVAGKKVAAKKVAAKKRLAVKKTVTKKYLSGSNEVNIKDEQKNFWVNCFAPRSRTWQNSTYREIKNQLKSNFKNPFESREQQIQQLRALEYILNKKPLVIK